MISICCEKGPPCPYGGCWTPLKFVAKSQVNYWNAIYVYYAIFDLLNFRSNYFAYFYNTYLSSSWCLIEWSIFFPASKATDGWLRKGKKGSHKTTFLTENTVFEEEKDVWMRWEGEDWWGVFFQYFGVKNHAFSMDIRWTFFKIFFCEIYTTMAAEQTWNFFPQFKKKVYLNKVHACQKQARNNFGFFLCFGDFSRLSQNLCENFWGIKLGAVLFKISSG